MDQPKYRIEIFWSDADGGYIANIPDLRYCSAFGESYEEALREVLVAMELHLDALRQMGRPIPEASSSATTSWASEPAEKFAEAIKESYQALADRSVSAQELNVQLTQDFFNGVINNLRSQAESSRPLAKDPIEQQRRQHEAFQGLTQESVNAYTDFLNSMFSYYRSGLKHSQKGTRN
jgi:predicted RNase H-like HicB family nuclease